MSTREKDQTSTSTTRSHQGSHTEALSTTSNAPQHQQQNHLGSTQHHSTTTSYSTTNRTQNTRTQQGSRTSNSNPETHHTYAWLPNGCVWPAGAGLDGGTRQEAVR